MFEGVCWDHMMGGDFTAPSGVAAKLPTAVTAQWHRGKHSNTSLKAMVGDQII